MSRAALALAVLCRAALVLAQPRPAPPAPPPTDKENVNKSVEFVNIIKEDLRRDNDDYSMLEHNGLQAADRPALPLRRSGTPPPPPPPPPPAPDLPDTRRRKDMTRNLTALLSVKPPSASKFNSKGHVKHYKKVPADKLKRLVEKSRIKSVARTASTSASPAAALSTARPRAGHVPRARPERPAEAAQAAAARSPGPDQLDMAPARGPQITQLRFKGRICQRSVMRFEGPTYDRLGKEVRPAFIPGQRGRQFHHTTPPPLVLPRCCNCCKKSVLGCQ